MNRKQRQGKHVHNTHTTDLNGHFCPKSFAQFSLQFGEIVFWWARRENSWAPPKFPPPLPSNQTPLPTIFSLLFFFRPPYFTSNQTHPKEINHTNITLISKVKSPENITKYRPISLCNVVHKPMLKVLANRLRAVLPTVV